MGSSWTRERVHAAAHRRQQALVQVGQHGLQHEHDGRLVQRGERGEVVQEGGAGGEEVRR